MLNQLSNSSLFQVLILLKMSFQFLVVCALGIPELLSHGVAVTDCWSVWLAMQTAVKCALVALGPFCKAAFTDGFCYVLVIVSVTG